MSPLGDLTLLCIRRHLVQSRKGTPPAERRDDRHTEALLRCVVRLESIASKGLRCKGLWQNLSLNLFPKEDAPQKKSLAIFFSIHWFYSVCCLKPSDELWSLKNAACVAKTSRHGGSCNLVVELNVSIMHMCVSFIKMMLMGWEEWVLIEPTDLQTF